MQAVTLWPLFKVTHCTYRTSGLNVKREKKKKKRQKNEKKKKKHARDKSIASI